MQRLIVLSLALSLLISCNPSKSILTADEKQEGWVPLFNGKNTKGWHRYGGGEIDSVWKVREGGILCLDTLIKKQQNIRGDWDIVTDEEYSNFDMKLEWMISKNGNSG